MAVKALAVVSGIAQQTDNTFAVELDIVCGTNNRAFVESEPFGPNDSAAYINGQLLLFVKAFILSEWGISMITSDSVKLLRPLQEMTIVQSLARRPWFLTAGW